jgi:hypothetical protein
VAGGHGYALTAILQKYPQIHGVLFDLEHVVPGAATGIEKLGLTKRCSTISGDFFKAVPAGDAYFMKNIIHDWDMVRGPFSSRSGIPIFVVAYAAAETI